MIKIVFILCVSLAIVSCKKADTCSVSKTTIAGTYLKTAIKYKASSSDPEQDLFSGLQPCEQDDTYELKTDGSVVVGNGATVCPGPPPPGTITAWSLSADNKVLTLGAILNINSFDCKTLVVTEKDFFVAGDSKTTTYVKQ